MKITFTILMALFTVSAFGQRIKYYDQDFGLVRYKEKATFYTETSQVNSLQGTVKTYLMDGTLLSEISYSSLYSKKRDGLTTLFYPDGRIKLQATYKDNMLNGPLKTYFPNQRIKRAEFYENNKFIQGRCFSTQGRDTAFYAYQTNPEFPGGQTALEEFVKANLKNCYYLPKEAELSPSVVATFVVKSTGEITGLDLHRYDNSILSSDIFKMIEQMPAWIPATEDGISVDKAYQIPIVFLKM